jgi:hypothetical protein
MTLEEVNELRDVVKEHFDWAFVHLTDDYLIKLLKFNSFVYSNENHDKEYGKLRDNWRSLKRTAKSYIYHSFYESERKLHNWTSTNKFQYLITIDVNVMFNHTDFPEKGVEEKLITCITHLKQFLKEDELFNDWDFKLAKYNMYNDKYNFHILILNIKDKYKFLPLQWELVDKVNS